MEVEGGGVLRGIAAARVAAFSSSEVDGGEWFEVFCVFTQEFHDTCPDLHVVVLVAVELVGEGDEEAVACVKNCQQ